MDTFYDIMETVMENVFQTIYIFLWIWYVNVCFFNYNRRMQELEVETVGLRRIVYAFMNDKTKMNEKKQYSLITKRNQNKNNEIDEKLLKLKKGVFFLKKHMDELTERVELLEDNEDEDYASSVACPDDGSTSDGSDN